MRRPTRTCLALARSLTDLAERHDVPRPEVAIVRVRSGVEGVRAVWPFGPRRVVVTVLPAGTFLSCYRGFAAAWRADLETHGVDSLRRALAWLMGEVEHPEDGR